MLHSHLPYVLNHGRWPHGSDWICEAAIETYLPLLEKLRALDAANIAAPVTIGFTPILANMLEHPTFAVELEAFFAQRFAFCDEAPASMQGTADESMLPLVGYWRARLERLHQLWRAIDGDILGAIRDLQDRGRLEVTSSAATHGFLPLLGRDASIHLQLALGRAEHRRIFGRDPEGCWVPECAYRGAGHWEPLPGAPGAGQRRGTEEFLADADYRYFYVDSHMARAGAPLGIYGALFGGEPERLAAGATSQVTGDYSPYQAYRVTDALDAREVAAFVRDPRTSQRVWNRHGGYPGDGAYLEFHKIRWPGGLRLWRVTSRTSELGDKQPYLPEVARAQVHEDANDFARLIAGLHHGRASQEGAVVVAPFDTELLGHWWFEGPDFMGDLYAALPEYPEVKATTAAQHLDRHGAPVALQLADGSWGKNGTWEMWMNDQVAFTWPVIWEVEGRFWDAVPAAIERPDLHPILEQAARSMLLLQSSDWQFIISTGEVEDYAIRRFNGHADDCRELLDALAAGIGGADVSSAVARASELQQRDDVFRDILPSIELALERAAR
jgi:1,4-alpha-glucan branching enzyme